LLGTTLLDRGDPKGALDAAEHAIEIEPTAKALALRGRLRLVLGAPAPALEDLLRAVELEPMASNARSDLASAYVTLGRVAEGMKELDAVLEREPDHVNALRTRAQLYASSGRIEEAQRDAARLESVAPTDLESGFVRAVVAYYAKDYQRALDLLEAARRSERAKEDLQTLQLHGQCLRMLGRAKEAIPSLRRIVELNPREPMARLQLGGAYAEAGDTEKAKVQMRRFLELAPPGVPQRAQVEAYLERLAREGK